jgi:hypothetical protein
VENRQISEIETLLIRSTAAPRGDRGTTPRGAPALPFKALRRTWNAWESLISLFSKSSRRRANVTRRSDQDSQHVLLRHGKKMMARGLYPFTDDCNRIENGSLSTNVPVA